MDNERTTNGQSGLTGYFRVAAVIPAVKVADVSHNISAITEAATAASQRGAGLTVTPELSLTGYTCGDLLHSSMLLDAAHRGIGQLARQTAGLPGIIVAGAPLRFSNAVYNCAVFISRGAVLAVVPKTFIPNYNEFYEKRWFASGVGIKGEHIAIGGCEVPFGTDILVKSGDAVIGAEICEDLWAPLPPSTLASLAGANIICNLSASNDLIGKYSYLLQLIGQQSGRCICGYVYAGAGEGESSTDLVFEGKAIIAENGTICEQHRQPGCDVAIYDIDLEAIKRDRLHNMTFGDCAATAAGQDWRIIETGLLPPESSSVDHQLLRHLSPTPFVPPRGEHLHNRTREITDIQVAGLVQRLRATGCRSLTVGISGGLDSTLALLVACRAFDRLDIPRSGIIGVTMPGFGTTGRTYRNAIKLMEGLGVTVREVPIAAAVMQHFSDIGHDPQVIDVTYENSQARERTQILMDIANQTGGMVLGTGDLSELALGWATYNGDHMSMYGVNAGVPKTLVRYLVEYYASTSPSQTVRECLADIIDTPISPELTPADDKGEIAQKTEDLVGPYELHDFFLYYTLRYGFSPRRIYELACRAFAGTYDGAVIRKWLRTFYRRFFAQQFKRSCLPDGPKVGSVCLSPRGDWRMPSDASAALWLDEVDRLQ